MGRNLNDLKTENMDTRDELKEMIVNHAASWKKEEGKDDMADIYVDDFLNELLSKFKLLPIQSVVPSALDRPSGLEDDEWYCPNCKCVVPPHEVTNDERHGIEGCFTKVN